MRSTSYVLLVVSLLLPLPVHALIGDTPTIKAVAILPGGSADPLAESIALLGMTREGTGQLIVRTVNRSNGSPAAPDQMVALPGGVRGVDVIFSRVFAPDAILVLCDDLTLREYRVAFDSGGLPMLIGDVPAIRGPFGDPALIGSGTALAEAPGFACIGTANGILVVVRDDSTTSLVDLGKGAVTGLATIPQVGYFAFVAAHDGHATGVDPNAPGITAAMTFDLADPRPDPLLDLGAVFEPNGEPMKEPAPVSFVSANGTRTVTVLQIPANPTIGGVLTTGIVVVGGCPIGEVDRGSLFMLAADGGAVLYDPGFELGSGGSGVIFTVAGAAVEIDPDTLNLESNGKFITARIEAESDSAAAIDPATLLLHVGASAVGPSAASRPRSGDSDHDGQSDLLVKFDRQAVVHSLGDVQGDTVVVRVTWRYGDGSSGSAATTMKIRRRRR